MRDHRWVSWVLVAFGLLVVMYEVVTFLQEARPESLAIYARVLGVTLIVGGMLFGAIILAAYIMILLALHFSKPLDDEEVDEIKKRLDQ